MFCTKCGQNLDQGDVFCGNCGTKQTVSQPDQPPPPQQSQYVVNSQPTPMHHMPVPRNKGPSPFAVVMLIFGVSFIIGAGYYAFNNLDLEEDGPKQTSSRYKDVDDPDKYDYDDTEVECKESIVNQTRGAIFGIDQNIRSGPSSLSIEEEEELGDEVLEQVEEEMGGRLVTTSKEAKYIARIGETLAKQADRSEINYRFYMMEDTDVENAFALPGGHVVITRPLFDTWVENEAQLATIIGHEIIHVDRRHTTAVYDYVRKNKEEEEEEDGKRKKKSKEEEEEDNDEIAILVAQILTKVAYSPKREAESDELGAELIHNEGYSTFQSVEVWEQVDQRNGGGAEEEEEDGSLLGTIVRDSVKILQDITASHPDPAYRACNLKRKTYELYQDNPLDHPYRGIKNYNKRKAKSEKMY